ncbi:flavin-containing monooxygenase [Patulibacter minatonensis]|uniref:flavin-containing monooxygenase n=1 Tax=Patulibacter minatonensis TaxID=298163 RepID=UPI001B7FEC81|nr:NAD(P)/FAD-dependent oxidoreductase [Patulibacter minatonensis]
MTALLDGLPTATGRSRPDVDVGTLIVGGGFSGIAMAVGLRQAGQDDWLLVEQADELGGVWRDNVYPGAACDVPSYLYSLSTDQRKDWDRPCPRQEDIRTYLHDVARHHRLTERVRTGVTVDRASWDEATARWTVEFAGGERVTCAALAMACGQLSKPAYPSIPGREDFAGDSFHSARWDHDVPLKGRRVAVVGTGASAAQFVPPVAEEAGHLDVYQRTANWMLPRRNRPYAPWARRMIQHVPGLQALRRTAMWTFMESGIAAQTRIPPLRLSLRAWSTWHMRNQVKDPALRAKLIPDYPIGCKRVLFSSSFLPALVRDDVEVVVDPIVRVTPTGVVARDADGTETERPVDVLIWGTGFKAQEFVAPIEVDATDVGGTTRRLADEWRDGAAAHLGITVAGFPNLFLLYGPNTNLGFGSIVVMIEAQVGYVLDALRKLRTSGIAALALRGDVQRVSTDDVQDRLRRSVWSSCDSWYRQGKDGRIVNNWPGQMVEYRRHTREVDLDEYEPIGRAEELVRGADVAVAGR